jgi:ABC-type multidrug transport system ATPase subunit
VVIDASPAISLRDAVAVAGGFPLLSGVTLDVPAASLTVVTGSNGAGKTSLLMLLGGLVRLTGGSGVVAGVDLAAGDLRELRRRVGWLGHE